MKTSRIAIAFALSVRGMAAQTTDFHEIATTLQNFRSGGHAEISIRFTATAFKLVRESEAPLAAAEGERLTANIKGLPQLEIARDGHWYSYEINRDLKVAKPIIGTSGQSTRQWKKRTLTTVASYPRSSWPGFIDFAVANGLSSVQSLRYGQDLFYTFSFSPMTPDSFSAAGRSVALNADFRENMRFSSGYAPHPGPNGFVVLLHDPHQHIAGRYQTLAALRALALANPGLRFRFLVEGLYQEQDRSIPFNGIDKKVNAAGETRGAFVYSLLSRFLINTPTAYRLLYDQGMPAHAIDDNTKLKYPAPPPSRANRDQLASLSNLVKSVVQANSLSDSDKLQAVETIKDAAIYLRAEQGEASGDELVSYYNELAESFRKSADLARSLRVADAGALAADAAYWEWQRMQYQNALDRNPTMVQEIVSQTRIAAGDLSIAFIGNFHTSGIIPGLQAAGIGYVVIEPRLKVPYTEEEAHAFEQANHGDSREAYLNSVLLNMGFNGLTATEVRQLDSKFDAKLANARTIQTLFERDFGAISGSSMIVDRLAAARNNNGSIAELVISSGGNQPPPPGNFGTAFAWFDPNSGKPGGKPILVIADPKDRKWSGWERYNFLRNALFFQPKERAGINVEAGLDFYSDPGSGLMFVAMYDARTRRTYCFERETRNMSSLIPAPFPQTGDRDARMQLTEIIRKGGRKDG